MRRLPYARRARAKLAAMAIFGFAAGTPNAALLGTLYAWLSQAGVDLSTIGVLSWGALAYGFKFLWSPLIGAWAPSFARALGKRRAWILICQSVVVLCLGLISISDPASNLATVAALSVAGAFAGATLDLAVDSWRIESSQADVSIDAMSATYQFGYRTASFLSGAGALFLSDAAGWPIAYGSLAALMALAAIGGLAAPNAPESAPAIHGVGAEEAPAGARRIAITAVLALWGGSAAVLFGFMAAAVLAETPPNVRGFVLQVGPWIVLASIGGPALIAAWLLHPRPSVEAKARTPLYDATLAPLTDLLRRLGWGTLVVLALILTYRFTDSVWGSFAYPFYLGATGGALGHTASEVAIASKTFGVIMTLTGVPLAALALSTIGRMPSLVIGAAAAALTNLLYADLANGALYVDDVMRVLHAYDLFSWFGADARMARLMAVIAAENVAGGFATAVYVAYLSAIANPRFATMQYALLASLTLLIGALGRGALGELIDERGFADAFILTALLGVIALFACVAEWIRQRRQPEIAT